MSQIIRLSPLCILSVLTLALLASAQVKVPDPLPDFVPSSNLSAKLEKAFQIP